MASETLPGRTGPAESPAPTRRPRPGRIGLVVLAAALAVLAVLPLVYMVTGSLKTRDQVTDGTLIPHHVTWHNYVYVFTQVPFTRYLLNSFFISAVVTVAALFFHSMAAYALAGRGSRGGTCCSARSSPRCW
jgi:multiple sugar transport system permease protein